METRKKITRFKLEIPDDETKYSLFGLVTAEPDYRLSFAINKKLNISLKKQDPLEIHRNEALCVQFSRFNDLSGHPDEFYSLVANKAGKHLFLQKYNQIDYLFLIGWTQETADSREILTSLRNIDGIIAVVQIKDKDTNMDALLPH